MIRVQANRETCSGFATCVALAPDVFDLDNSEALVIVTTAELEDDQLDLIRQAVYDCPTDSISFVHDTDTSA